MIPALFTDLYELNMAQAYRAEGMAGKAVFELIYRKLPDHRNFIVAAGLEDVLRFLVRFRFTTDELDWLRGQRGFSDAFVRSLEDLRFTGDVYAVPEGTPVFPHEPLLQVVAPITEAQLVETALLNMVHFQSLALTKADRIVRAAKGRQVIDFGSRRAPGGDAALSVARATYLAGGHGTSNVLAGRTWGMPIFGTMAHSYIQAHETETDAFEAFASLNPGTTLLVDTYDTLEGVRLVVDLKRRLGDRFQVSAVRLDSGDLATLARETRRMLDAGGLGDVTIFASSGLDEYQVARLVEAGAPIDAFGVGTKLAVSADAPEVDMAYKLVEYAGKGRFKLSRGKTLYPGRKQVFRQIRDSHMAGDAIGRFDESLPGLPLLRPSMLAGAIQPQPSLEEARHYMHQQLAQLPEELLSLEAAREPYAVHFSKNLVDDLENLRNPLVSCTHL
ncbi:MAG: nicotinate phosphoribosyltransferase [Bryobacteraceae bacterium]|jgi:nicotinate phosphoribosyltransferase